MTIALMVFGMAASINAQMHTLTAKEAMLRPIATSCMGNDRIQVYLAPRAMYTWLDAQSVCNGELATVADMSSATESLTLVLKVRIRYSVAQAACDPYTHTHVSCNDRQ
jgi:hypothetical protein